jgi:hypothetical protein
MERLRSDILPASSILHRVLPHLCGMASRVRNKRRIMAFRAFFDESGLNPREDKALIMGGFIGTFEEWIKASDAWDACLRKSPSIEFFKHDDAMGCEGQFRGFSRDEADEKMRLLAEIIASFDLQGAVSIVPHRILEYRGPKPTRGMIGTRPYDHGFFTAIGAALSYVSGLPGDDKVDFIFDRRSELRLCIATYNQLKEVQPERFRRAGECSPGDDSDTAALQMADLLAGELFRQSRGQGVGEPWKIIAGKRKVILNKASPPPAMRHVFAAERMRKEVLDQCHDILKRVYGDNEKSVELVRDFQEMLARKDLLGMHFDQLVKLHEGDEGYREFVKKINGEE